MQQVDQIIHARWVIPVEPADTIYANTIYNAFVRQFGPNMRETSDSIDHDNVQKLESEAFSVIPPAGTFRNLIKELDFIIGQMGFNILNPFTYGNLGKAIDKTRSGDQNVEYENTPTGQIGKAANEKNRIMEEYRRQGLL